jgi:putative DNA primase/helicase
MFNQNSKTLWADKVTSCHLDPCSVAQALGGNVIGYNRVLAPGPRHSRHDRSLSVHISSVYPEGFWVKSFAGDDELLCRDHVRERMGLPSRRPSKGERASMTCAARPALVQRDEDENRKAAWVRDRFREIWAEAREPRGTIVQKYLAGRGLELRDELAGTVIRFHPNLPWKDEDNRLILVPAMVCAMRNIQTDEIVAIHRRRLTPEGEKVGKPMMLGPSRGAAVKLDPDETITLGLVLAEGVETALSARQFGYSPAWAAGCANAIARFPVLGGIEGLTLAAEEDKSGANARAIADCRRRYLAAGCDVMVLASRIGGDLNNALTGVHQ